MLNAKLPKSDITMKNIQPGFFHPSLAMINAKKNINRNASPMKTKADPLLIASEYVSFSISAKYRNGQLIVKKPKTAETRRNGLIDLSFSRLIF